jgi:putative lipoprotein (rSAM/lipoprotein system)
MKRGIKNLLLSLIGFSAAPMLTACYGLPYDDYDPGYGSEFTEVKGHVVNTELQPIKGIEVAINGIVTTTNEDGYFHVATPDYPMYHTMSLRAEDKDGEANGGYYGTAYVNVTRENCERVGVVMSKK